MGDMFNTRANIAPFWKKLNWGVLFAVFISFFVGYLIANGHYRKLAILFALNFCGILFALKPYYFQRFIFVSLLSLFFIPALPVLRPEDVNYKAYYAIVVTISAVAYMISVKRIKIDLLVIYLFWFIANAFIFYGAKGLFENYMILAIPFTTLSLYFIISEFTHGREIIFLITFVLITAILQALIGILQSFYGWPVFSNIIEDTFLSSRNYFAYIFPQVSAIVRQGSGTFQHFNGLGSLLALTSPLIFGFWRAKNISVLRFAIMCIIFLGVFTTYSRGALLGSVIGCSFIIIMDSTIPKFKALVFLFVCIIMVYFCLDIIMSYIQVTGHIASRVLTWLFAIEYSLKNPINLFLGYGIFSFNRNILGTNGVLSNLHSGQLQIFLELGVVGFSIFIVYFTKIFYLIFTGKRDLLINSFGGGILSFFIQQLFDNSMFGLVGVLFFCFAAVLKVILNQKDDLLEAWWYGRKT